MYWGWDRVSGALGSYTGYGIGLVGPWGTYWAQDRVSGALGDILDVG